MNSAVRTDLRKEPRRLWNFLIRPAIAAGAITCVDGLILFVISGASWRQTLVLALWLEGGLGLLAGTGIALSSTPSISRAGEMIFNTAPWSRESEKNAESVGLKWILGSSLLVLIGLVVSTL
jgi:zinc transporter ZupT